MCVYLKKEKNVIIICKENINAIVYKKNLLRLIIWVNND